jgi:TfoX/Sxy family transcriptional regulator of competence genes
MPDASKTTPKMKWEAAPPDLVSVFEDTMREFPEGRVRKMFGYPAAFVKGKMAGGLFQDTMMLRLSEPDLAAAREIGAKPFEPMPGQVMRGWVVVPAAILQSRLQLKNWIGKALTYTGSLPAKQPKSRARKPSRRQRARC